MTLRFLEQATPFTLEQIWGLQRAQTSTLFTTRYVAIQKRVYYLRVHNVDKQKQSLMNVWNCMDHCITDDATIHILVHVCGQMWTLQQYYDSISILSGIWHEMFHFCHTWHDSYAVSFVTFDKFKPFNFSRYSSNIHKVRWEVVHGFCCKFHDHHHHLFAQYAEMNSKICNVQDRKANSFSSNNCP